MNIMENEKNEGKQVKNGKAFEYALAITYFQELKELQVNVALTEDKPLKQARKCFNNVDNEGQKKFLAASKATFDTLIKMEPGLRSQINDDDVLFIRLASDAEGQSGDVRDVIFSRPNSRWEIGISAKNNNEDAKHSRLGPKKTNPKEDWGWNWYGVYSTDAYWNEFNPVLDKIDEYISKGYKTWDEIKNVKEKEFYIPALKAFKNEIERQNQNNPKLPHALTTYIIGKKPFYKVVKDDKNNLVIVKAFNILKGLNMEVNGVKPKFKAPKINLPTRIIKFDFAEKKGQKNTLEMVLNKGWSIKFRLHSAKEDLTKSLKFAVALTGNPPILFSQFLFQEE